jgi:hypothetical protein
LGAARLKIVRGVEHGERRIKRPVVDDVFFYSKELLVSRLVYDPRKTRGSPAVVATI